MSKKKNNGYVMNVLFGAIIGIIGALAIPASLKSEADGIESQNKQLEKIEFEPLDEIEEYTIKAGS